MKNWFKKKNAFEDQIEVETFHGRMESIDKAQVDYVMLYTPDISSKKEFIWLKLGSHQVPSLIIPTENKEKLEQIEGYLFGLDEFDQEGYRTILENKKVLESNQMLWKRRVIPNYKLSQKQEKQVFLNDLEKGVYLENLEKLVAWGNYKDLEKLNFVKTSREKFPNPDYHAKRYTLKNPIIFGGLQLEELYTETDSSNGKLKFDLPVIKYMAILQMPNPEQNLAELAEHFNAYFQQDFEKHTAFKTLEYTWKKGRVQLKLYCGYREELQQYDPNSYFTIEYKPDVSSFYASEYLKNEFDPEYCDFLKLDLKAHLNTNYREVDNAAYTPKLVNGYFSEEVHLVLWFDQKNNRFCVADSRYTLIFRTSKIKKLSLDIQLERGREAQNSLQLEMKNGKTCYLGSVERTDAYRENYPKIEEWGSFSS